MGVRTRHFDHRRYPHPNMTGAIIHAANSSASLYYESGASPSLSVGDVLLSAAKA